MAIISISGKKTSGKDTVGKIIQYLITNDKRLKADKISYEKFIINSKLTSYDIISGWTIKKFADSLKDMLCIMTGTTREQWEDEDFKNTELGEEWWYWKLEREGNYNTILLPYNENTGTENYTLIKPTPRLLLQLLGTECGRNIIHPNVWVNALFADYNPKYQGKEYENLNSYYPNWIITDTRFPNELEAVKIRGGITIRVNRPKVYNTGCEITNNVLSNTKNFGVVEHISETALDNAKFNYTIDNNEGILELIQKVREILIKEKFING